MAPDAEGSRNSPLPLAVSPGAAHRSAYPMNPYKSNKILQPNHAAAGNTVVVLMQTASAVHGGGYVSQRIVNFYFKHVDLRHARRGAFLVAFVAQSHSQFEMRAPEIGLQPDSGFELPEWRQPLRRDRPAGALSPGALRRGRASGELAASETPSGPDFWRTTIATPAHCARLAATSLYCIRSQSARCSSS
jgi:hypothetical protein